MNLIDKYGHLLLPAVAVGLVVLGFALGAAFAS